MDHAYKFGCFLGWYYNALRERNDDTNLSLAYIIICVDDFDCGIITFARHNSYYDRCVKLVDCYGEKMQEEALLLVEDYYINGNLHVFDQDWSELPFAYRKHIG